MWRKLALNRDLLGGPLMMVIGLSFAYFGQTYGLGTTRQVGAGFMPIALGLVLAGLGFLILVNAAVSAVRAAQYDLGVFQWPDWRGLISIVVGITAFILLCERAGLVIATFVLVFIAAYGDRSNRLRDAALLAIGVTVVGAALFYFGLQIKLPLLPKFH